MAASQPATRPQSVGRYVVRVAFMHVTPEYTGDGGAYRHSFEEFATAHGIPESHWPNELFIRLREKAKSWNENTFQADTFPPWGQMTSGLQRLFGLWYAAAEAWTQLCAATRKPNESGPGALQRKSSSERSHAWAYLPSNPGPIEGCVTCCNSNLPQGQTSDLSGLWPRTLRRTCLTIISMIWRQQRPWNSSLRGGSPSLLRNATHGSARAWSTSRHFFAASRTRQAAAVLQHGR